MRVILVLHNIRSTYNVGAILRTAEGFGVEKVILSGYTPRVHDPELLPHLREKLDRQISKVALGAEEMVEICLCDDLGAELTRLREEGWKVVGLENNIDEPVVEIGEVGDFEKVVLVLGEEVDGISPELYQYIDVFAEIPMRGRKESFNVSVAAGIAMYALMSKK